MAERAKSSKAKAKKAPKGATGSRGKVAKAPGAGHNSGGPAPELVKSHHDDIGAIEVRLEKAKQKYDQMKGELRSRYAVVKQDGIDLESFKLARSLHKQDHGVVVSTYAKTGDYLAAIKSELATQLDLFQSMTVPSTGNASLAGAHAFGNEEPRENNPHKAGSEEFAAWDASWMAAASASKLEDGEGATIN